MKTYFSKRWNLYGTNNSCVFAGSLPSNLSRLGEADLCSNRGVVMRATTVGSPLGLPWDSMVVPSPGGGYHLNHGLSYQVWHGIHAWSGLEETFLPPAPTWGSSTVLESNAL